MDVFHLIKTKIFIIWLVSELEPTHFVYQPFDFWGFPIENNLKAFMNIYS